MGGRALLAEGSGPADTIEVLTRIAAAVAALRSVGLGLVDDPPAARRADTAAAARSDPRRAQRKVEEASEAVARIVRS